MGVLAKLFRGLSSETTMKPATSKLEKYVYYKIVDFIESEKKYLLQCVNANAAFYCSIVEIVSDIDILCSLHPIQSCYIGIEYAKHIRQGNPTAVAVKNKAYKNEGSFHCRYGIYNLSYQDRNANLTFMNQQTNQKITMDARDIALSEELIQFFDAHQAFHIGLTAGLKLHNPALTPVRARPSLQLVK